MKSIFPFNLTAGVPPLAIRISDILRERSWRKRKERPKRSMPRAMFSMASRVRARANDVSGRLDQSTATLTIITADGDGWLHGILRYDPPQADGFAGSPFTTHIDNGTFSIRLFNGTSYADMHWCRDRLCGVFHAPDDTTTPVDFARPGQ